MDETMPDALPLTKRFLSSLARFMEHEHRPQGDGDISVQVRCAIEQAEGQAENAELSAGLGGEPERAEAWEH